MAQIEIRENNIVDAARVLSTIPESEFGGSYTSRVIEEELKGKKFLVVVAYCSYRPVGCVIGFDKYHDGSFYCWLVGVAPDFRGLGIMTKLMQYQDDWAKMKEYRSIRIKTRNDRRGMLNYLIKDSFFITGVAQKTEHRSHIQKLALKLISIMSKLVNPKRVSISENRIMLEKEL